MEIEQEPALSPEAMKLTALDDIVALVPHRLGFHPSDSVVLVLVDERGNWFATSRHDLPPGAPLAPVTAWMLDVASDAAQVMLGVYAEQEAARSTLVHLLRRLPGPRIGWILHATGWEELDEFALCQAGPRLGPDLDADLDPDLGAGAWPAGAWTEHPLEELWARSVQLELWRRGSVPEGSPSAHHVRPAWTDEPTLQAWERARAAADGDDVTATLAAWDLLVDAAMSSGEGAPATDRELDLLAQAVAGLHDADIRDAVLLEGVGGLDSDAVSIVMGFSATGPDRARLAGFVRVLETVTQQTSGRERAALRTLLAWCDWATGRSSVASAGLQEALVAEPGYRFAELLGLLIDEGVVPEWLRRRASRRRR